MSPYLLLTLAMVLSQRFLAILLGAVVTDSIAGNDH